ncbi:MAG: hypothetical protein H7Z42_16830 [Roseiflexaceae bacterium]|nr:hypothetical protein [Roseiflexaceae bacterium]
MEQFSIATHRQSPRAWFEHPVLVLFLPYSVQTVPLAADPAALRRLFESSREPWRQVAAQGPLTTAHRRYEAVASGGQLRIDGPYGNKAWTMTTLVTEALDAHGSLLTLRTFPHRSIVFGLLAQLAFISIFAVMVGVPGAPWFPLLFFMPFLYVASIICTKVEAARIATLVRQAIEQEQPKEGQL